MIVILTQDLMMSSSAGAVARAGGMTLKTAPSVDKATQWVRENEVNLLLVDLQMPALKIAELSSALQSNSTSGRPYSIAYAQHVNVDLLKEAKQASFDEVLTRGQLNGGLEELFQRHA